MSPANENSIKVSEAFSKQAEKFDALSSENKLTAHLRTIYRKQVEKYSIQHSRILELNCGTGIDAIYFANKGYDVLATDNAPGMLDALQSKIASTGTRGKIEVMQCSYHELNKIKKPPFDHIVSNFGGLNCTADLQHVLAQFSSLLTKNGKVTLALMPKVCPWELAMALKGKFKTAFRRFGRHAVANVEGVNFLCYYYNPSYVKRILKNEFNVVELKGVYITVPPEFYLNFVERYPRLYAALSRIDNGIANYFPFNRLCDHYIITLEKK